MLGFSKTKSYKEKQYLGRIEVGIEDNTEKKGNLNQL
jgi:hypothetical protein